MARLRHAGLIAALPGVLASLAWAAHAAGWRLNWTSSEPRGFYRMRPYRADMPLSRGDLAQFCPPRWVRPADFLFYERGTCPGGGMPMLKTIAGVPGEHIVVTDAGVTVNGVPLAAGKPQTRSPAGVALPRWRGVITLAAGQYWMYGAGGHPGAAAASFDSRYWGPVRADAISAFLPRASPSP